jgi:hypothetical protein
MLETMIKVFLHALKVKQMLINWIFEYKEFDVKILTYHHTEK